MIDIERLPVELKAKADSETGLFEYVNITLEDALDPQAEINRALGALTSKGGKTGVGVVIGQAVPVQPPPNVSGPELLVRIPVSVIEQPEINRQATMGGTGLTRRQVAIRLMQAWHRWGVEGLCTQIYPDPQSPWAESSDFEKAGFAALDLWFVCAVPLEPLVQCGLPVFAEAGLTVTLTNVTDGAAIYYTLDGQAEPAPNTFPGPSNKDARVYSEPFAVASGTRVRWAAWRTDYLGSDVGEAVVS